MLQQLRGSSSEMALPGRYLCRRQEQVRFRGFHISKATGDLQEPEALATKQLQQSLCERLKALDAEEEQREFRMMLDHLSGGEATFSIFNAGNRVHLWFQT